MRRVPQVLLPEVRASTSGPRQFFAPLTLLTSHLAHLSKDENVLKQCFKTHVLKHVFFVFFKKNMFFIIEGIRQKIFLYFNEDVKNYFNKIFLSHGKMSHSHLLCVLSVPI